MNAEHLATGIFAQRRTQVLSKYERDEALYREIINFANGKPHLLERGSTDLVKAEIAAGYIMKFPDLGLEKNKDALQLLLELKYEEVESAILSNRDIISQLNYSEEKLRLRAHAKLEARGVLPATD